MAAEPALLPLGRTFVLSPDCFRTALSGVGFCLALHLPEQISVVLKRCSEIGMLRSKGMFEECQSALVERFCPTVLTLCLIDHGEIVERGGEGRMLRSNRLLQKP